MKEMDEFMTAKEMARLSDWLESKGHTPREIIDCIHYIAETDYVPIRDPVETKTSGSPTVPKRKRT